MKTLSYGKEMIQKTIQLIQIPSVKGPSQSNAPFGKPAAEALEWVLSLCEELGMRVKNIGSSTGYAEIGQGVDEIGILCHLDVVPVEEARWVYPPFQGVIEDDRIYGRGAIDDKGPTIAAIYAVKRILEEEKNLTQRIRLIFFTDEESGWADVPVYLSHEKASSFALVPDGSFPLIYAEKGILHTEIQIDLQKKWVLHLRSGLKINMVPDTARVQLAPEIAHEWGKELEISEDGEISFQGKAAHGSLPDKGENAFLKALSFLGSLEKKLDEPLFFGHLFDRLKDCHGKGLGIHLDDFSGRLTLNAGKAEILDGRLVLSLDIRYPVSFSKEEILTRLESVFMHVREIHHQPPLYRELKSPEIQCLMEVYEKVTGSRAKPIAIGGGTLARAFPNAVAFGAVFPGEEERAHMNNEYITIENLLKTHEIYTLALKSLLALPKKPHAV